MEAIRSSETSVQSTTSTRRQTPEDGILHSHRRENLKSYKKNSYIAKLTAAVIYRQHAAGDGVDTMES
jgi:hypothetical protein